MPWLLSPAVRLLAVASLAATPSLARAASPERPVVVELFTSQGCSSCPPADALVTELARQPGLLPLTFHVTYWNRLGWVDPFSFDGATQRQKRYAALSVSPYVYTPAMVVDGKTDVIGSDRQAVAAALRRAATQAQASAPVTLLRRGDEVDILVGAGPGRGSVLLIGFDRQHTTAVARGENSGRTLMEANIVRSLSTAGTWSGAPVALHVAVPAGERTAVIVQSDDGHVLGAAVVGEPAME